LPPAISSEDMMQNFVYDQLPYRVVFGAGAFDRIADEADRLGLSKLLVLSTPGQAHLSEEAGRRLGARVAALYPHARMHVPVETAEAARAEARRLGSDGAVAIGGGRRSGSPKRSHSKAACRSSPSRRPMPAPR
jgi:maleylacetate reductase